MADPTIYRYEIPVDDRWHDLELTGPVLHIAARQPETVEFWALANDHQPEVYQFRVFGTGQPLPPDAHRYYGTALAAGGRRVWHMYGRDPVEASRG